MAGRRTRRVGRNRIGDDELVRAFRAEQALGFGQEDAVCRTGVHAAGSSVAARLHARKIVEPR